MSGALNRPLPENIEAEQAVLGAILQAAHVLPAVQSILRDGAAEFARERHGLLFEVFAALPVQAGGQFDGLQIEEELKKRGKWESFGKYEFLAKLLGAVPSALRAEYYAQLVHQAYLRRRIVGVSHALIGKAKDTSVELEEVLSDVDQQLGRLAELRCSNEPTSIVAELADFFEALEAEEGKGLSSPWPELDRIAGGFAPSELIVIAARPSLGKTSMLLNLLDWFACKRRENAVLFSLEMSRRQVMARLLSSRSGVPMRALYKKDYVGSQEESVSLAHGTLREAGERILIDDESYLPVEQIVARAHARHRRSTLHAVLIDYMQLVQSTGRYEKRYIELGAVSRRLKALAKQLQIPVIVAAQLGRPAEDAKPAMHHLRESGNLEQDADKIVLLHRPVQVENNNKTGVTTVTEAPVTTAIVAKNRNGPTGKCELQFRAGVTKFVPVANPQPETSPPKPAREPDQARQMEF